MRVYVCEEILTSTLRGGGGHNIQKVSTLPIDLLQVDRVMGAGLIHVTWASLNVENFLKRVEEAINTFECFTKQILDIYECRIQANLVTMSSTQLLSLPGSETWTTDEFLSKAQTRCSQGTELLIANSRKVEDAVKEMLLLLTQTANLPTIHQFDSDETIKSKKGKD